MYEVDEDGKKTINFSGIPAVFIVGLAMYGFIELCIRGYHLMHH